MRVIGLVAMMAVAAVGCGGSGGDGGDGSGGSGSGGSTGKGGSDSTSHSSSSGSTSSFECCINQDRYSCPDEAAADQCANFANPDPSGCTHLSTPCGSSTSSGSSSGSSSSGDPQKKDVGVQCKSDDECKSDACIFKPNTVVGICSQQCESWADCPSFWDCTDIGLASGTYCVPPN